MFFTVERGGAGIVLRMTGLSAVICFIRHATGTAYALNIFKHWLSKEVKIGTASS